MSSISNEELDEIWNSAFDEENELILRLITEVENIKVQYIRDWRRMFGETA